MNSFVNFISDSKVHDSVLMTMIVTSFLAAIRRFKTVDDTPIAPGFRAKIKLGWNFFYDWLVGFWSMKTGQAPPGVHIQTSEQTATTSKTEDATFVSASNPTPPVTPVITK